jgi:hypothetical protein
MEARGCQALIAGAASAADAGGAALAVMSVLALHDAAIRKQ